MRLEETHLLTPPGVLLADNTTMLLYGLIGGLIVGSVGMFLLLKVTGIANLNAAKKQAEDVLNQAKTEGETLAKQIELDARNEQVKRREAIEKELEEARDELAEKERRLTKREDNHERKLDMLTLKEKNISDLEQEVKKREQAIEGKQEELDRLVDERRQLLEEFRTEQKNTLLRVANMSEEDAKREALKVIETEVQHEAGQLIQKITDRAEEEAKDNALKITLQAIQRYASEHSSDHTVTAISIPSDDMKGRIIGREGRNIRAFEAATGVDVIVDDTPGVVVVSCFDPIRRAVASETLQKLLDDGRIHPARIEELTEQVREDVQSRIIKFGKDALIEANIQGLHPRISEMVGRLHYRTSYGQNILKHSMECAYLCQVIAEELGLDGNLARRCGLLHDIGKAMDHEMEGGHPAIGMEFCRKFGEKEAVLNAIGGHHDDIPHTTPYTAIVMAADAISGARPGARRETLDRYVKRLEQLEGIAKDMKGVNEAFAIQAGREVRVIVDPKRVDDTNCNFIARDIAKRVSEEMTFPGEIKVTVLREMRTVEFAK
ncbi:MAG: ribonuclease Y [Planctomycetota bacterium]